MIKLLCLGMAGFEIWHKEYIHHFCRFLYIGTDPVNHIPESDLCMGWMYLCRSWYRGFIKPSVIHDHFLFRTCGIYVSKQYYLSSGKRSTNICIRSDGYSSEYLPGKLYIALCRIYCHRYHRCSYYCIYFI